MEPVESARITRGKLMFVRWLIFFFALIGARTPFNHYSLLKTLEDIFGLDHLGYAAQPGLLSFFGCASRACPGKVDPLFRQGHASQVFELARILSDQVIPPDRKAR
jgi:hypothetical protein